MGVTSEPHVIRDRVSPCPAPGPPAIPGWTGQRALLADDGRDTPGGLAVRVQPQGRPSIAARGLGGGVSGPRRSVGAGPRLRGVRSAARAASLCLRHHRPLRAIQPRPAGLIDAGRLSGPRRELEENAARAASAWEHCGKYEEQAHQADTGLRPSAGRSGCAVTLCTELKCHPGTHRAPGWFVNRSPKITPQPVTVQALRVAPAR
jgi:hypothetical protein